MNQCSSKVRVVKSENLQRFGGALPRGIFLFVLIFGPTGFVNRADDKTCTKEDAIKADSEIDSLKDWDAVYRSYRRFSQCDDGSVAEGYSNAVGQLLANHWSEFRRLQVLTRRDKGFERFVLRHTDSTLNDDIRQEILRNAQSRCPEGARRLCSLITHEASSRE